MGRPAKLKLGLYSRPKEVSRVDRRTTAGRLVAAVREELIAHVGGAPTVAQRLLIEAATHKAMRLAMVSDAFRQGIPTSVLALDETFLKFSNSLRADLQVLGIQAPKQEMPTLASYLQDEMPT